MKLAIITVMFLSIASSAYAECSWVLWSKSWTSENKLNILPDDAFKTRAECLRKIQETQGNQLNYLCLPDTIDPRGFGPPKGK